MRVYLDRSAEHSLRPLDRASTRGGLTQTPLCTSVSLQHYGKRLSDGRTAATQRRCRGIWEVFVSVAGIDGSGKTRLAQWAARKFGLFYRKQTRGRRFEALAAGDLLVTPMSRRGSALASAYSLDFHDYATRYGPKAGDRCPPIYDRWKTCVRAYAHAFAINPESVDDTISVVPDADLEILLDVPVQVALRRIAARGIPDSDENEAMLASLRESYIKIADKSKSIVVVCADREFELISEESFPILSSFFADAETER